MRKKSQKANAQATENKLNPQLQARLDLVATALENKSFEFKPDKIAKKLTHISRLKPTDSIFQAIDKNGENLIHAIIKAPEHLKLEQYIPALAKLGANFNHKNLKDLSPLFVAVQLKRGEALKKLHKTGIDLTITTIDGVNILDYALVMRDPKIFQLVSILLKLKQITLTVGNYLIEFAENGPLSRIQEVEKIASEWKVNVNFNVYHPINLRTALIAATREKHADIVKYLLEKKADSSLLDSKGLNVLMHAVLKEDTGIIDILLANNSQLVHQVNQEGTSALHVAIEGKIHVVKKLLEHKADINHEDKSKITALHRAISFKNTSLIDLFITDPLLNIDKFSSPILCLDIAIKVCSAPILDKLLKIPALLSKINGPSGWDLYKLAIDLNKDAHCKILMKHGVNLKLPKNNPLYLFCMFEKIALIRQALKLYRHQLSPCAVICALDCVILERKRQIAIVFLELMGDFPKFLAQYFPAEVCDAYMNYFAKSCIITQWLDLALKCQPKLKWLVYSSLFANIPPFYLVQMIKYLQASSYSLHFNDSETTLSAYPQPPLLHLMWNNLRQLSHSSFSTDEKKYVLPGDINFINEEFDFSETAKRIPWLRDYMPDPTHPDQWLMFMATPSPKTSSLATTPTVPKSTSATLTPFAFFIEQGLSTDQTRQLLRESKTPKSTGTPPSIFKSEIKQSGCSWLAGQITHQDPRLHRVEGSSVPNTFLFIPETLQETIATKSRWRFHPKTGLKPLRGLPTVKVSFQFGDNIIECNTSFTHEITTIGKDRILCIKIKPDNRTQRGILYVAACYLKGGLHHHETPSPTMVLDMSHSNPAQCLTLG